MTTTPCMHFHLDGRFCADCGREMAPVNESHQQYRRPRAMIKTAVWRNSQPVTLLDIADLKRRLAERENQ